MPAHGYKLGATLRKLRVLHVPYGTDRSRYLPPDSRRGSPARRTLPAIHAGRCAEAGRAAGAFSAALIDSQAKPAMNLGNAGDFRKRGNDEFDCRINIAKQEPQRH